MIHRILIVLLIVGGLVAINQPSTKETQPTDTRASQIRLTTEVCMESRGAIDGGLEEYCGELQDKYNLEFLCDMTACWVEDKLHEA